MKPTMFNNKNLTEFYLIEIDNMSYDQLCDFAIKAYEINYDLGLLVANKICNCLTMKESLNY